MAAPTENDIKALQDQIDKINEQLELMDENMKNVRTSAQGANKQIGETGDLLKDAVGAVKNISTEFRKFATDSKQQYEFAEGLAKESKSTAVSLGLAVGRSKEFTKSFNRSSAELAKLGYGASEVSDIMSEISENSGRSRIISPDEVERIGLISKALGMQTDTTANLYERFERMGVSAEDFSEHINNMTKESQKLGLNAKQVAVALQNNMEEMSRHSFKNGVKGMTEMAKLSVQMKMNVGDMLRMSEKFYNPEAAIESVANLQMLGGEVAEAFGDPFETMYLARNKPEELAKKVKDMTDNMMQFNEETGEYELPAEARMQLQAIGKELDLNVDSLIDMSRQSAKIKDITMNVSGNIADEDMREGLASMAKMKDGKWVVDFDGKEVGIEDIGVDLAEKILAVPKNEEDAIMSMAQNSMTTNQILENILEAMKTGFVAESNVYELTEEIMRPGMEALMKGAEDQVTKTIEYLQTTPYGKLREMMLEQAEVLGISSGEGMMKIFEGNFAKELAEALKNPNLEMDIEEILKILKSTAGEEIIKGAGENVNKKGESDFLSRSDGGVTSFTTEDDVVGAKKGGPLDKLLDRAFGGNNTSSSSTIEFGNLNISGRIELVSPDGSTKEMDMASIKPMIEKTIINHLNGTFRNGGVPSSKESSDYMAV